MPHSISPLPSSPPLDDSILPDAPAVPLDADSESSSESQDVDVDVTPKAIHAQAALPSSTRLEDMFEDDDDDEFSSSAAPTRADSSQEAIQPPARQPSTKPTDPETMKAFYQRLFPFRPLFQWLNHSPTPGADFAQREFAFTLQNDAYLRYQSFATADLLRKQCVALVPARFEIGPVYSANPRDRKTLRKASAFRPLAKELVFDIDMTDYDDIRTCCAGASICARCWTFITMAIKVVDVALREDFGFAHVLWVYSGRRGAHAWVCDRRAREMDDQKRRAVAGYLELLKGGDKGGKKVNVKRPLHPHLDRSLQILRTHFAPDILAGQDPWSTPARAAHLLSLLPPDASLLSALRKKWDSAPTRSSTSRWADIDALASTGVADAKDIGRQLLEAKQDIVLEYSYPRLDAEVSKKLNHLLKAPFCVHPGTGRVCVPIDVSKVEEFDPEEVPTVGRLLGEIDSWDAAHADVQGGEDRGEAGGARKVPDVEKTSLKPYVEFFKAFVAGLLREEKGGKREREAGGTAEGMEF
ncbi:hypothetical protein LTR04_005354 [Oleoguttula sp. CCFEE 6159]|nr:hypothetical protein LTR04_005354 [Oleoguttula sp. CCFEE 6159]